MDTNLVKEVLLKGKPWVLGVLDEITLSNTLPAIKRPWAQTYQAIQQSVKLCKVPMVIHSNLLGSSPCPTKGRSSSQLPFKGDMCSFPGGIFFGGICNSKTTTIPSKNWMRPNPNGPLSCDWAIRCPQGFFGVREKWVLWVRFLGMIYLRRWFICYNP